MNRLALLALIGMGLTTASNAGPFQNGSFELGPYTNPKNGYEAIFAGDNNAGDITGWVVSAGRVDWVYQSYRSPKDGSMSVTLDSPYGTISQNGAISQTFTTIPGQSYVVNFSLLYGYGQDGGGYVDKVDVSLDGSTVHEVLSGNGNTWYDYSATLLANSASSTLTFTWAASAYWNSPFLDAVTVTAVPGVPDAGSTLGLLGGAFAMLGVGRRILGR